MWNNTSTQQPPLKVIVNTKIDDSMGVRNEQTLYFDGKLWWHPDGSMYVYYKPTHWQPISIALKKQIS